MTFSIKKLPECEVSLTVDLDKTDLQQFIEKSEKILISELSLPGFRKGRVPLATARKYLQPKEVKEKSLDLAISESLSEVIVQSGLEVMEHKKLEVKENSPQGLTFEVTVVVFPEVSLGKYTDMNLSRQTPVVKDEEVEKILKDLIKMRSEKKEVQRAAETGDLIEADFSIFLNSKIINGGASQNHPIILGEERFVPGFERQIIGLKSGQEKTFNLDVPADYYNKEIAGKKIEVKVVVKTVKEIIPPKLNDEFAKSLGQFDSLDGLRTNIRNGLTAEKEEKEKEKTRLEILNKILDGSNVELPQVLVARQLDSMISDFNEELSQKGMELGLYLAQINQTQNDLRKQWQPRAEKQVKTSLIIRKIAKNEKIKVSTEEINGELAMVIEKYTQSGALENLKKANPEIIKERIGNILLSEKVCNFLEEKNIA